MDVHNLKESEKLFISCVLKELQKKGAISQNQYLLSIEELNRLIKESEEKRNER